MRLATHSARQRGKERRYHELVGAPRCHLLAMGFEVGGRWSEDAVAFLRMLARYKAQSVPRLLRKSTALLFFNRWSGLLACAVQRAYAASLLGIPLAGAANVNGAPVPVADLDRPL